MANRRAKYLWAGLLLLLAVFVVAFFIVLKTPGLLETKEQETHFVSYNLDEAVIDNPLIGFAPEADYTKAADKASLVFVKIAWSQWEPEEGVFDVAGIQETFQLERWKNAGKHVVLRFVCDDPDEEEHMDIPQWLYDKTGDGTFYAYDETHKGYSPNYNNQVFIEAHARTVDALGEALGEDTFVSYVQLGSLGHWGEWHVRYDAGISRIPQQAVREKYVEPYMEAFPNAKLLMRRPFAEAAKYGTGLYDDMAGHPESSGDWLGWIKEGGDYNQPEVAEKLTAMPNFWKTAPAGGEFTSDIPMEEMLGSERKRTIALLRDSHTTFLGPKVPHGLSPDSGQGFEKEIEEVKRNMGYRLRIASMEIVLPSEQYSGKVTLTWTNDGVAPMYWDWPVYLNLLDENGMTLERWAVDVGTSQILPGEILASETEIPASTRYDQSWALCLSIEDPMLELPAVQLAMRTEMAGKMHCLYVFNERSKPGAEETE